MENKLQQLTEKLYAEGLEKGRAEADQILSDAKVQADKIVADAKSHAAKIAKDAEQKAEELTKNTANDIRMASAQTLSALRSEIEKIVLCDVVDQKVSAAWSDLSFVKGLITDAVRSWDPSKEAPITISVAEAMVGDVSASMAEHFSSSADVVFDGKMRIPFRIAPRDGSYYVSFTDEDFATLIKQSLRPRVVEMLFGEKQK